MGEPRSSRMEQILDLLAQEIQERLARTKPAGAPAEPAQQTTQEPTQPDAGSATGAPGTDAEPVPRPAEHEAVTSNPEGPSEGEPIAPQEAEEPVQAMGGGFHAARLMRRLVFGLFIALVVVNIPFNRNGLTLARAMPNTASFIVRDGFVAKEENDPDIYVYQNGKFRWISSLDAFEHYGYTWKDVHIVPDGYLDKYDIGSPIHVLLKCQDSPHIYRLEGGKKRWIRDIDTFLAEGHVWEDVRFVSCDYLRDLPDGETIPPDSGPPPQP